MWRSIRQELMAMKSNSTAQILSRFFKTGKGEYGEGDQFLGIKVPAIRNVAKKYAQTSLSDLQKLIVSPWHEIRFCSLCIANLQFARAQSDKERLAIYRFFVRNFKYINNWDLVDCCVPNVVGAWHFSRSRQVLFRWAQSKNLWHRRISVLATFYFIKKGDFHTTLQLAHELLEDRHDLMHKAVGWMLREIGKRDRGELEHFLNKYYRCMPRTMLRYAIERLPPKRRAFYMAKK